MAALVAGGLVLAGIDQAVRTLDTYRANLTNGHGDFPARSTADLALYYASDGYHVVDRTPGWVASYITAPTAHTALAVQLTVRAVQVPATAAFGPCVRDQNGSRLSFLVAGSGEATLFEEKADGTSGPIATASAPPLKPGTQQVLYMRVAVSRVDGTATLTGYVNGVTVISGSTTAVRQITASGMAGYIFEGGPAEWVVSRFARLRPDATP